MDQAALSRILNGLRGVEIGEAKQLAKLLGQEFDEICRRLGM